MRSLISHDKRYISNWIVLKMVILACLIQNVHHFAAAQFFGTGSSRLDNNAQEVVKEMAQEFTEVIEDKE